MNVYATDTEPQVSTNGHGTAIDGKESRKKPSLKLNLVLAGLSVLVTLLFLEVALRSYDAIRGRGFFHNDRNVIAQAVKPVQPFRTFGLVPYQEKDGVRYISSRHGELYPLEKPEGTYRIVAFGGSTTENARHPTAHYPLLLQSELRQRLGKDNIEVINVGYSAYATPHSLILLELDALSWDPDLIIVSHNINDLSALYWPDFTFDYSNKYSDIYYMGQDYRDRFTAANAIFQHSQVYWVVKSRLNRLLKEDRVTVKRKSYGLEPDPVGVAVFERNLRSFISLGKSNDIQVLLATQPITNTKVKDSDVFENPYNKDVRWPFEPEVRSHHDHYNRAIKRVAEANGVWFVDNALVMNDHDEYFFDSVHYTEAGLRKLADNYADFLTDKLGPCLEAEESPCG